MSENVACLALIHKTEMHGELVSDVTWFCQPLIQDIDNTLISKWIWIMDGLRDHLVTTEWPYFSELENIEKSKKMDCIASGFTCDYAVNFVKDICLWTESCPLRFSDVFAISLRSIHTVSILSICPSIHLWTKWSLLHILHDTSWIHNISYQPISAGVSLGTSCTALLWMSSNSSYMMISS